MTVSGVTYHDIMQMRYAQTWNGKTGGARYWMEKGVGPIAIEWIAYDSAGNITLTTARIDAVVTDL
jgi:hypothetical protein